MSSPFNLSTLDRLFAQIAVKNGYVAQEQVDECARLLSETAFDGKSLQSLGSAMVERGYLTETGFREVLALQKKLQEQREQFAWSQIEIGDTYAGMSKLREALEEYAVVVKEYDEQREVCAVAHCKIGDALRRLGEYEQAIATYENVLKFYPDQEILRGPEIMNKVGFCRRSLQEYETALGIFQEVLRRHANYEWYCAWALDGIADVRWDLGDVHGAAAAWGEVVSRYGGLREQGPAVVAKFGLGLVGPDELTEAAPRLEMLLDCEVMCYIARRCESQGNIEGALRCYKEVAAKTSKPQWAHRVAEEAIRRIEMIPGA